MSYTAYKTCNLGHKHDDENGKQVPCTGTLRVIDYTNVRTSLKIGERYTFRDKAGHVKRFRLGCSTGWKPCLLLLHNSRSTGSANTVNGPDIKWNEKALAYDTGTLFF
jgi:hypothetical protein